MKKSNEKKDEEEKDSKELADLHSKIKQVELGDS